MTTPGLISGTHQFTLLVHTLTKLNCRLFVHDSCRREGFAGHYIGGQSPPLEDEPNPETLDVDYTYFDNVVWPNLAHRVPSLQNLKVSLSEIIKYLK